MRCHLLAVLCVAGCFDATVDEPPSVTCKRGGECPTGFVCFVDGGVCVDGGACVDVDGDVAVAKADGSACDDGVCVAGSCVAARCGDGFRADDEACDDGNDDDGDGCVACAAAFCGDGAVYAGVEACDDGNDDDGDGCDDGCVVSGCGNGVTGGDEGCDDGNDVDDDGCSNACALPRCGDDILQAGEECDDGNDVDVDGCHGCVRDVCGDGVVNAFVEDCDDGDTDSGDGCRGDCKKVEACGDVVTDAGEDCDDGNANPRDGCDACVTQQFTATLLLGGDGEHPDLIGQPAVGPSGEVFFVVGADGSTAVADTVFVARDNRVERAYGDGSFGFRGVGLPPTSAQVTVLRNIAVDALGRLWVDDVQNGVRRIGLDGNVEQVAGGSFDVLDAAGNVWTRDGVDRVVEGDSAYTVGDNTFFGVDVDRRVWVVGVDGALHIFTSVLDSFTPVAPALSSLFSTTTGEIFAVLSARPGVLQRASIDAFGVVTFAALCGGSASAAAGVALSDLAVCDDAIVGVDDVALVRERTLWRSSNGAPLVALYTLDDEALLFGNSVSASPFSTIFGATAAGLVFQAEGRFSGTALLRDDGAVVLAEAPAAQFASDRAGGLWLIDDDGDLVHQAVDGSRSTLFNASVVVGDVVDLAAFGDRAVVAARDHVVIADDVGAAAGAVDVAVSASDIIAVAAVGNTVFVLDGTEIDDGARVIAKGLDDDSESIVTPDTIGGLADIVAAPGLAASVGGSVDVDSAVVSIGFFGLFRCDRAACVRISGEASAFDGHALSEAAVRAVRVDVDDDGRLLLLDTSTDRGEFEARVRRLEAGVVFSVVGGRRDPVSLGPSSIGRFVDSRGLVVVDGDVFSAGGSSGRVFRLHDDVVTVAVGHSSDFADDATVRARWAPLLAEANAITFDAARRRLFVGDAAAGAEGGAVRVVDLDVDGDGAFDDPLRWTARRLSPSTAGATGLSFDVANDRLLLVDSDAHCVRSVDVDSGVDDVVLGVCGAFGKDDDVGDVDRALLFAPTAAVRAPSGALYVSDAGNQRVRRAADGVVTTVIGEGSASTAGEGRPARSFPIEGPGQLFVDAYGNLFVAARSGVREVANVDGDDDADGDDLARTVFAGRGNDAFPDRLFACISGVAEDSAGLVVGDSCTGLAVQLR